MTSQTALIPPPQIVMEESPCWNCANNKPETYTLEKAGINRQFPTCGAGTVAYLDWLRVRERGGCTSFTPKKADTTNHLIIRQWRKE